MIEFTFILTSRYSEWHMDRSFSYLEYEGDLKIKIGSTMFFDSPFIISLEFLRDALAWANNTDGTRDMLYNCISTSDNPLISFVSRGNLWQIASTWQLYRSEEFFTREELVCVR